MSESTSRRRVIIPIFVAIALSALVANWIWSEGANERRVDELLEMAYDYTGLGGEQPTKLEHAERLNLGESACGQLDDWYGAKAATKSADGADVLAVAEPTAQRFADEGWAVERLVSDSEFDPKRYIIVAERNADRINIDFFEPDGLSLSAQSGPCIPRGAGRAVIPDVTEVERFP